MNCTREHKNMLLIDYDLYPICLWLHVDI